MEHARLRELAPERQNPQIARQVLNRLSRKQDGQRATACTATREQATFNNAMEHACERHILPVNPLTLTNWPRPRVAQTLDLQVVAKPRRQMPGGRPPCPHGVGPGASGSGGRVGRAQRRRPAAGVRQVRGRTGGRRHAPNQRGDQAKGALELRHVFGTATRRGPLTIRDSRTQREQPLTGLRLVRGCFHWCGGCRVRTCVG